MTAPTILRFDGISPRARRAIDRAGGSVHFNRRTDAYLVAMPQQANWHPGIVDVFRGQPRVRDFRPDRRRETTVYYWPCRRGLCVLQTGARGVLWHWRDPECLWAMPF